MQTFFRILSASAALAATAAAAPTLSSLGKRTNHHANLLWNCDVSDVKPYIPEGQTNVTIPADQKPRFVTVGVGVQNYTCSDAGVYVSAGAVASIYDISCIARTPLLPHIQELMFTAASAGDAQSVIDVMLLEATIKIADHYFNPTPDGKIIPVFDFTNELKNKNEFVSVKKNGGIAAPTGSQDIDWLDLERVDGHAAQTVFRLNTHLGQPAPSCKPGDTTSVPYSAQYWFYQPAPGSPPPPPPPPAKNVIDVIVGKDNAVAYSDVDIEAPVGSIVRFHFVSKNHTVTESAFASPCAPKPYGFNSGFKPIAPGAPEQTFDVEVKDDKPIWFYCAQRPAGAPKGHCALGMNGGINAPKTGDKTLKAFQELAAASD